MENAENSSHKEKPRINNPANNPEQGGTWREGRTDSGIPCEGQLLTRQTVLSGAN